MKKELFAMLMTLVCCMFASDLQAEHDTAGNSYTWERYRVLSERNVFLKERTRESAPRERRPVAEPTSTPAPVRSERYIVLTGIVRQGSDYVAFLEDTRTQTTTKIRTGESVALGRIDSIALDHIQYIENNQTIKVNVGSSLDGTIRVTPPTATTVSMPPTGASTSVRLSGQSTTLDTDTRNAILERLRQRRLQELQAQRGEATPDEQANAEEPDDTDIPLVESYEGPVE